ncbi:Ribophorin II [Penicillium griseofulvum]|uniref:Ribophorin II n=1 Tax=Penicillium patulum TaxID=5078 RepID=A0A135LDK2_PENPA|nr:Ribophorin II [Penicillium griseofulvum]KXG47061.1 Ribophorin II [Penicillium griseofulvum]
MHMWQATVLFCLLAAAALPGAAATAWGFTDATVAVQPKGAGVNGGFKEKFVSSKPLSKPVSLVGTDTLRVILTAQEDSSPKRPDQAFLLLKDAQTGLDISYPFNVKDNGKSRVELTQKDLPIQFLSLSDPVDAHIVIGGFGSSDAYDSSVFKLSIDRNPDEPVPTVETQRYGKKPEIHHIFKESPSSPPIAITLAFVAMVCATIPALAVLWLFLGANVNHLPTAFKSAPLSHTIFLGSLVGFEGIFFLYYTSWNLFQVLPAMAAVGVVAFVSGSRALGEVQGRRLAGLR